jgi:hypothetical protein
VNRYSATGVIIDILDGKQVLVLSDSQDTARIALRATGEHAPAGLRTYVAHGHERIEGPTGGCARFQSAFGSVRGLSVDVVYLDLDEYSLGEDRMYELTHLVALHGEVIRR